MSTGRMDADAESSFEDGFSVEDMTPPVTSEISSAPGGKAGSSIAGLAVCPFCGSVSETPGEVCRRCSMENNAMTRQATRARIGPWYVMQARNPSAPGMKYNTLLTLIRKGQVTPQSVMRGPTTHQLWRFAAKVKGISREFGLCYSCGGSLERSASVCPTCSRLQDLPANPDTLLETEPQTNKPVYVEAKPSSGATASAPAPAAAKSPAVAPPSSTSNINGNGHGANGSTEQRPAAAKASAAPRQAAAEARPAAETRPARSEIQKAPPPAVPNRNSAEPVLSPKELAAAFSLQFVPDAKQSIFQRPGALKKVVLALCLMVLIGSAAVFTMVPTAHDALIGWMRRMQERGAATNNGNTNTVQEEIRRAESPSWGMKPPVVSPPIGSPATLIAPAATADHSTPAPQPSAVTPAPAPVVATPVVPAPAPMAKQEPANPTPQPQANPAPVTAAQADAAPKSDSSPQIAPADMDVLAMQLRSNGLDAEARHDYASAQSFYEQIEKLPRSHWPADTDQLLQSAKQKNQQH